MMITVVTESPLAGTQLRLNGTPHLAKHWQTVITLCRSVFRPPARYFQLWEQTEHWILPNSWFGGLATMGATKDAAGNSGGVAARAQAITTSGCPNSTGWPFSAKTCFTTPALSDSISFMSFMASMMQSVSPTATSSPTCTNGWASGDAAR